MRKRAAALLPEKTVGPDEKGLTSWLGGPRLGREFIKTVPDFVKSTRWLSWLNYFGTFDNVGNAKGFKAVIWLAVAGTFAIPANYYLVLEGVRAHGRHGGLYGLGTSFLVAAGISTAEAIRIVALNPDSTALELAGEACGHVNIISAGLSKFVLGRRN